MRSGDATALHRLVAKYRRGRRSAADVCQALAALRARNDLSVLNDLWLDAMRAVYPVPLCLFTWGMRNVGLLDFRALTYTLRAASYGPRLSARVPLAEVCARPEGTLAAMQDPHFRRRVTPAMLSRHLP